MASALSCNCVPPITEEYDDYTKYTHSTASSGSSEGSHSDGSEVLNASYKRATPLFRAIEKENWEGVLLFLKTGKWSNSIFASSNQHMRSPSPTLQVKTWITAYDRMGDPEWSQLPLHAAISYSAPFVVIQKLVELYPKAIQCTDNEGMLPIHLAYGFGAADNVLATLMEPFPTSVNEKGLGGRYPYECCELGPNKIRGKVYKMVSEQITERVTAEIHDDWKKFAVAAQDSVGLKQKEDVTDKTLHEFLLELLKDRKELEDSKQPLGKPLQKMTALRKGGATTSTTPTSPEAKKNNGKRAGWGNRDRGGKKYNL